MQEHVAVIRRGCAEPVCGPASFSIGSHSCIPWSGMHLVSIGAAVVSRAGTTAGQKRARESPKNVEGPAHQPALSFDMPFTPYVTGPHHPGR